MADSSVGMCISSDDCKDVCTDNKPWSFFVIPPYPLIFQGKWSCSVESVFCEVDGTFVQPLCCHVLIDFVAPRIAYNTELRIAATLQLKTDGNSSIIQSSPVGRGRAKVDLESVHKFQVQLVTDKVSQHCTYVKKTIILLRFTPE